MIKDNQIQKQFAVKIYQFLLSL